MATVQLNHIKKVYPNSESKRKKGEQRGTTLKVTEEGVLAVQDFNLDIADREFIVLVGPSGCGKSTTLRMVAGLEEISGGDLIIDGKRVNDIAPKDRDIAMVFQSYALYPHMTVYGNMDFPLKMQKITAEAYQALSDEEKRDYRQKSGGYMLTKDARDRKIREAAEILNITQYLERKPKALSGGQRQRVAIGRAIVRAPKVMLMDEPLSNLDAKLRNEMRAEIIKLRSRIDTTFIYVTHDQTEAMTLGDRIVIMKDGVVQQVGTPQEVFDHPANLFVAGFIGMPQMNLFDAELTKTESGYTVTVGDVTVALSEEKAQRLAAKGVESRKIILGLRPIHAALSETEGVVGKVDVSEMMGGEVHLHVNALGRSAILIIPTTELSGKRIRMGDEVRFTFSGALVHIFDPETEENLEF